MEYVISGGKNYQLPQKWKILSLRYSLRSKKLLSSESIGLAKRKTRDATAKTLANRVSHFLSLENREELCLALKRNLMVAQDWRRCLIRLSMWMIIGVSARKMPKSAMGWRKLILSLRPAYRICFQGNFNFLIGHYLMIEGLSFNAYMFQRGDMSMQLRQVFLSNSRWFRKHRGTPFQIYKPGRAIENKIDFLSIQ